MIKLKNIFEAPSLEDGKRVLITRLWPLEADVYLLKIDRWLRDLAPSYSLLERLREHPKEWAQFQEKYLKELDDPSRQKLMKDLALQAREENITLLYPNEVREKAAVDLIYELIHKFQESGIKSL